MPPDPTEPAPTPDAPVSPKSTLTSEQAHARVKDAWAKGHDLAATVLGLHRAYEPFTYEAGAKLVAVLEAAAFDPASDLDAIAATHIKSLQ